MSMLYYDVSRYKDFTLEVEYRNPNESIGGAWIGFDGEINDSGSATTWYGDSTGTVLSLIHIYKISYTISKSGDITMKGNNETKVVFQKKEDAFKIHIYNGSGERILGIDSTQMEFAFNDAGELIKYNLKLPLDRNKEEIYGSGERFNELSQVGKRLKMWNLDASYHGDDTLNAELWRGYKNIPCLLYTSRRLFFTELQ